MWKEETFHGEWKSGVNAGGAGQPNQGRYNVLVKNTVGNKVYFFQLKLEKFWTNPQYMVRINFIDDDDNDNLCTLIIALMQKDTRQRRSRGLHGEDYIQFRVFKVKSNKIVTMSR